MLGFIQSDGGPVFRWADYLGRRPFYKPLNKENEYEDSEDTVSAQKGFQSNL
jgi:hypothetical protein